MSATRKRKASSSAKGEPAKKKAKSPAALAKKGWAGTRLSEVQVVVEVSSSEPFKFYALLNDVDHRTAHQKKNLPSGFGGKGRVTVSSLNDTAAFQIDTCLAMETGKAFMLKIGNSKVRGPMIDTDVFDHAEFKVPWTKEIRAFPGGKAGLICKSQAGVVVHVYFKEAFGQVYLVEVYLDVPSTLKLKKPAKTSGGKEEKKQAAEGGAGSGQQDEKKVAAAPPAAAAAAVAVAAEEGGCIMARSKTVSNQFVMGCDLGVCTNCQTPDLPLVFNMCGCRVCMPCYKKGAKIAIENPPILLHDKPDQKLAHHFDKLNPDNAKQIAEAFKQTVHQLKPENKEFQPKFMLAMVCEGESCGGGCGYALYALHYYDADLVDYNGFLLPKRWWAMCQNHECKRVTLFE